MKCSDIKVLLSAYANDELSITQKEFVEEHLPGCVDCRTTLADYQVTRQQLTSLRTMPMPVDSRTKDDTLAEIKKIQPSHKRWYNSISHPGEKTVDPFWSRIIPKTRLAWILLPFIILLLGGAVYGAVTVVRGLFEQYAPQIEKAGLAQEMDLSQTIDGITVKLERAYADSNVVLVGYAVSGPDEKYFALPAELSMENGTTLQGMTGIGVVSGSDMILGSWQSTERTAVIMTYDASAIEGTPEEVNLQLQINVDKNQDTMETLLGQDEGSVGPFIFNFAIPFHGSKEIAINRTVEASGIAITLNEVVISPWATRVSFQIPLINNAENNQESNTSVTTHDITLILPQNTDLEGIIPGTLDNLTINFNSIPIGSLTMPDGNSYNLSSSKASTPDDSTTTGYFEGDFTGQTGTWTFEISELVYPIINIQITQSENGYAKGIGEQIRITGPWIFQFQVP